MHAVTPPCVLGAHYVADAIDKTMNKTERNLCLGGADILAGETDNKQTIKILLVSQEGRFAGRGNFILGGQRMPLRI